MKFDSPLFDRIRVKPDEDRRAKASCPACEWRGCNKPGGYRAPKGRGQEGKYWRFCLDHVRDYNHAYNYFAGMKDDAVAAYQRDAATGHRPTWKMGLNPGQAADPRATGDGFTAGFDPFDVFGHLGGSARTKHQAHPASETRQIRNAERRAFATLGLEHDAEPQVIKAHYKALVKRHHPDANGGDRSHEDRLRDIIQAYNYLKSAGFC